MSFACDACISFTDGGNQYGNLFVNFNSTTVTRFFSQLINRMIIPRIAKPIDQSSVHRLVFHFPSSFIQFTTRKLCNGLYPQIYNAS